MHVDHLLQLDSLGLTLLWGEDALLTREISGATATDLEDPARFLRPGEIVLSGLVWWNPADGPARTDRFVSALSTAGAGALLAGEETHGTIPADLVEACRAHRVPLLAVPARTSFRAVTDAVYPRQWGDPSRRPTGRYALRANARTELGGLLDRGAGPDELLDRAFAHLGGPPCYLLTATGRTVARTPSAPALPAQRAAARVRGRGPGTTLRVGAESTPYSAWHLHLPRSADAPPRVLHETADVLARYRHTLGPEQARDRRAADRLVTLLAAAPARGSAALDEALRRCGLPAGGPYRVFAADTGGADGAPADDDGTDPDAAGEALAEVLGHLAAGPFAVGRGPSGGAVAVLPGDFGAGAGRTAFAELWTRAQACRPGTPLHAGISLPATAADGLAAALVQARFALGAARTTTPRGAGVTAAEELDSLGALLAGVPAEVRAVYSARTLGPLGRAATPSRAMLLETLEVFLAHDCSWARTAEALHLHVNTVHYRIGRVESLTGRDLGRLDHRLDLRAALLCR